MFSFIALSLCRFGLEPDFGLKCNMPAPTQVALLLYYGACGSTRIYDFGKARMRQLHRLWIELGTSWRIGIWQTPLLLKRMEAVLKCRTAEQTCITTEQIRTTALQSRAAEQKHIST